MASLTLLCLLHCTMWLERITTPRLSGGRCHSERSEESVSQPVTLPSHRFFAALRMTGEIGALQKPYR